jgi:T-complex protein 1 subunit gamma
MHPRVIVGGYMKALDDILAMLPTLTTTVDTKNKDQILSIVKACLGTKFVSRFGDQIAQMAVDAVSKIVIESTTGGHKQIDIKRYARIEKLPGGFLEESKVLDGLMFNKDVVLPGNMKRQISKPRIVLLDMGLEYKKGESQTAIELTKESDFEKVLQAEEKAIQDMCNNIIRVKPTLVFTEKGCADLAGHFLAKAGITVIRRVKKTDSDRIARVSGATVVNDPAELKEADVGTACGSFEVKKLGDEYFTFLTECKDPKACTIVLRGASKDVLNEIERNLHDAMAVVRNIILDPRVLPGGGAVEMALEHMLLEKAKSIDGVQQFPYKAVAQALEVIPRTLIENCGGSTIRLMTDLRGRHAEAKNTNLGVDGNKGVIAYLADMKVFDTFSVKAQTYKTALESAAMLLRIDDIVSGMSKGGSKQGGGGSHDGHDHDNETFGDGRDG